LEAYEYDLQDDIADDGDHWFQSEHVSGLNVLCRPYASLEPELSASELMELDALADKVELDRLQAMGVLLPVEPLVDQHMFSEFTSAQRSSAPEWCAHGATSASME
jgi:hypothetical protein